MPFEVFQLLCFVNHHADFPCGSSPQDGSNREPSAAGRGWKRRNSRQSAVFGEAGKVTVAGISELAKVAKLDTNAHPDRRGVQNLKGGA